LHSSRPRFRVGGCPAAVYSGLASHCGPAHRPPASVRGLLGGPAHCPTGRPCPRRAMFPLGWLWLTTMPPPDDDCHEPPIEHPPVAGGSKTFLKPFVKGVASAGRSVGAGIYHAGKVVDAITDLTERISLPRNAATPNLSAASHAEFGPPLDSSEVVTEERREKSRRFRAFKK
ncbi:hypothetical protein PTTG_27080, partial [Puccinia triticina 1-1 BBBD Race 1]